MDIGFNTSRSGFDSAPDRVPLVDRDRSIRFHGGPLVLTISLGTLRIGSSCNVGLAFLHLTSLQNSRCRRIEILSVSRSGSACDLWKALSPVGNDVPAVVRWYRTRCVRECEAKTWSAAKNANLHRALGIVHPRDSTIVGGNYHTQLQYEPHFLTRPAHFDCRSLVTLCVGGGAA